MAVDQPTGRTAAGGGAGELVARNSRWKLALFLLPCIFFVLVALLGPEAFGLRPRGGWQIWVALPTALLFGAAGFVFARRIADRSPQIIIGSTGIYMRQWSEETIPWAVVRRCEVVRITIRWPTFQRLICLYLHDPAAHPHTAKRAKFFGRGWNLGCGDITMSTTGLDHFVEDFWEAIERHAPDSVALDGSKLGGPWRGAGAPP